MEGIIHIISHFIKAWDKIPIICRINYHHMIASAIELAACHFINWLTDETIRFQNYGQHGSNNHPGIMVLIAPFDDPDCKSLLLRLLLSNQLNASAHLAG